MLGKSAHLQVIPQQAPKTQQICHYRHAGKTSELLLLYNTGVDSSTRNNLANLGSFAKVSVPVHSIIPCSHSTAANGLVRPNLILHLKRKILHCSIDFALKSQTILFIKCFSFAQKCSKT